MRHFLRHLPLFVLAGCATTLPEGHPRMLATGGIGCERSEYGVQARTIAIYTRVVADRVCVLDAAGRCHPRVAGGTISAEVRLPQTPSAPPADVLRQELGRRGILARIARPRGPKMYASLGKESREDGLLVLEFGEIGISAAGDIAHVMVRASGTLDASDWPTAPGGDLVRLVRTSRAQACWRLERTPPSALAD